MPPATQHRSQPQQHHSSTVVLAVTNVKTFKDSVTGQLLPETLVRAARQLELEYFEKKNV